MKIKQDFILRQVADTWVVLPLGDTSVNFNGMLTLNESGALLWKMLERGADQEQLEETLLTEYNISREIAATDVELFLCRLEDAGCLEN